ncbi:hypothetical protein Y1Q_0013233 [Alligator mississippiensis]|uniref:Uncharacterized protein n=1 Tax=Alligator mississippiensis TaxID=8496 RepID=A0A151NUF7_ALLMI|nr:hypothetical protein Y1Q_0013233 [Alligator mississippiensis]
MDKKIAWPQSCNECHKTPHLCRCTAYENITLLTRTVLLNFIGLGNSNILGACYLHSDYYFQEEASPNDIGKHSCSCLKPNESNP